MFRNLIRRGIPVFMILALVGAVPAAAQPSALDRWEGFWEWVVGVWYDGETCEGDRGPGLDPDGLTSEGERGLGLDPDGSTGEGDRGAGLDPNG